MVSRLPLDRAKVGELVRLARHYNIFPIYFPRYLTPDPRHPLTPVLSSLVDEAYVLLAASTAQEIGAVLDSLRPGDLWLLGRDPDTMTPEGLGRIALACVMSQAQRSYFAIAGLLSSRKAQSAVFAVYPELREKTDDDGLLNIDSSLELLDGGILYRDHVLHYHQFLRRNFTSNPNFDFLQHLVAARRTAGCAVRVAVDHRRIMSREFYEQIFEFDRWYGAPFDAAALDDASHVGLTVVKRNQGSLFRLTNTLDRTEFFWSFRAGIKTLQVEEIADGNFKFDNYYLNRYVHAQRDIGKSTFTHVDGAVKAYRSDTYSARREAKLPDAPKSKKKIKLWRVDGDVPLKLWLDLVSFFFKSNEMVLEYFDPAGFEKQFEERVRDFDAWRTKHPDGD
jgi:hypothetical protein